MKTSSGNLNYLKQFVSGNIRFILLASTLFSVNAFSQSRFETDNSNAGRRNQMNAPTEVVQLNESVVIDKDFARYATTGPGSSGGGMADGMRVRVIVDLFKNNVKEVKQALRQYVKLVGSYPIVPHIPTHAEREVKILQNLYSDGMTKDIEEGIYHLRPVCYDSLGRERDASTTIVKRTKENWNELKSPVICINIRSLAAKIVGKEGLNIQMSQFKTSRTVEGSCGWRERYCPDMTVDGPTLDYGSYHFLAGLLVHEHARHFGVDETDYSLDINTLAEFVASNYFSVLNSSHNLELFELMDYPEFRTSGSKGFSDSSKDPVLTSGIDFLYGAEGKTLQQPLTAQIVQTSGDCDGSTITVNLGKNSEATIPVQAGVQLPLPTEIHFGHLPGNQITLTVPKDRRFLGFDKLLYVFEENLAFSSDQPVYGEYSWWNNNNLRYYKNGPQVLVGGIYKPIRKVFGQDELEHVGEIKKCSVYIDVRFKNGKQFSFFSLQGTQVPAQWPFDNLPADRLNKRSITSANRIASKSIFKSFSTPGYVFK